MAGFEGVSAGMRGPQDGARPGGASGGEPPVRVQVKYLSAVRDLTGLREETAELPAGSRLRDLAAWLECRHGLKLPDSRLMAILNGKGWGQYSERMDTALCDGDEVFLLPIIAGG
jgi:molybdopterin synthase catalytic subunit